MSYFRVPLGRGSKSIGRGCPATLLLLAMLVGVIGYEKYKVWITNNETRASKRGVSVLRR